MDRTDEDRAEPAAAGTDSGRYAEIRWLIDNSEGVVGLRLDGEPLSWAEVVALYMPSWST